MESVAMLGLIFIAYIIFAGIMRRLIFKDIEKLKEEQKDQSDRIRRLYNRIKSEEKEN